MVSHEPWPRAPLTLEQLAPFPRRPSFETLVTSGVERLRGVDDTFVRVMDALGHAGASTLEADTAADFGAFVTEITQGAADGLEAFWQDIVDNGDAYVASIGARLADLPPDDTDTAASLGSEFETPTDVAGATAPEGGAPSAPSSGSLTEASATAIVTGWYRETLGRAPDPSGLATWVDALVRRGLPVEAVHVWFLHAAATEIAARGD